MKVLTINCTYDKGSTGKIIMDLAQQLKEVDFFFCYETGPKSGENRYRVTSVIVQKLYYVLARVSGLKHSTGFIPTLFLLKRIKKYKPDIVHIHCPYVHTINVPYLLTSLKKKRIKTVITNHSEFFYTGNCAYAFDCLKFQTGCGSCDYVFDSYRKYLFDRTASEWKKMRKAFENGRNICMVGVSPWVAARMELSPICYGIDKRIVKNGINISVFNDCKCINKIEYENYFLHVTSSFSDDPEDLKGGYFLIRIAERLPQNLFLVAGTCCIDNQIKIPQNIIILGNISDQNKLADYYRNARLTVLTSRRETYGMSCAESLCCGTPVVGFKAGGTESIAIKEYSEFCDYGDLDELEKLLYKWADAKSNFRNIAKDAYDNYSSESMAKAYMTVYRSLLNSP